MNGYNINQEPADKLDVTQKVNQYIAFGVQPTIPQNISDRLLAAHAKRLENTMYSLPANGVDGEDTNADELRADMNTIEARHGRVRRMGVFASGRIDGIRKRQEDIARQIATANVYEADSDKSPTNNADKQSKKDPSVVSPEQTTPDKATVEKVKNRLTELEKISTEINQNIDHIGAVVAIKGNYLHQLSTAKKLLEKYQAATDYVSNSENTDESEAEVFKAAYAIIMHNIPRRYNPDAPNSTGHETIAQVIVRLEDEIADLNAKAAEQRFEVGLETATLNSLSNNPTTHDVKEVVESSVQKYLLAFKNSNSRSQLTDQKIDSLSYRIYNRVCEELGIENKISGESAQSVVNVINVAAKLVREADPNNIIDIVATPTKTREDEIIKPGIGPEPKVGNVNITPKDHTIDIDPSNFMI